LILRRDLDFSVVNVANQCARVYVTGSYSGMDLVIIFCVSFIALHMIEQERTVVTISTVLQLEDLHSELILVGKRGFANWSPTRPALQLF
jgi:hypothetical protein